MERSSKQDAPPNMIQNPYLRQQTQPKPKTLFATLIDPKIAKQKLQQTAEKTKSDFFKFLNKADQTFVQQKPQSTQAELAKPKAYMSLKGQQILDRDTERDLYKECPECKTNCFDTALDEAITCLVCGHAFDAPLQVFSDKECQDIPQRNTTKSYQHLDSVLLFVERESILPDFTTNSTINFQKILSSVLAPYFQMRTRILTPNQFFSIGNMKFYVASAIVTENSHSKQSSGKVSDCTTIRLTKIIDLNQPLECVYLSPLDRSNTDDVKQYFIANSGDYIHKNRILTINKSQFFVRHTRPSFGVITSDTHNIVRVDSDVPSTIRSVRIAPIWGTNEDYQDALQHKDQVASKLRQEVLQPYLQTGGLPSYVEKGETILISDQEFFVNDCHPREGIINSKTVIDLEVGFTKDIFNRKQVLADQRIASRLQSSESHFQVRSREDALMRLFMNIHSYEEEKSDGEWLQVRLQGDNSIDFVLQELILSREHTPQSVVQQLPVRELTLQEIENNQTRSGDGLSACLVCLCEYVPQEQVRTMPCMHFFHTKCIDKWLGKSISCPICKCNIKQSCFQQV